MASPTSNQILEPDLDVAFYLRIEGIGEITGTPETSRSLYVFTRATDWVASASQRFITGLGIPAGFSESADMLGGIGDAQGLTFDLIEFADGSNSGRAFWADMFATERWSTAPGTWPNTWLRAELDRDDVTAFVDSVAGFAASGVLFIGGETMTYSGTATDVPGGGPRFTGLTRGLHQVAGAAFASTHRIAVTDGAELPTLVTTRPYSFYGRQVSLYAVHRFPSGTWETEANALRLWTGRIRRLDVVPSDNKYVIACDSLLDDLKKSVFSRRAETRMVGLNLGDDVIHRTMYLSYATGGLTIAVTVAPFHLDRDALRESVNAAIRTAYNTELGAGTDIFAPSLEFADADTTLESGLTVPAGKFYLLAPAVFTFITNSLMGEGLAYALGWAGPFFFSLEAPGAAIVADQPAPATCFYHSPDSITARLYIEDSSKFLTAGGQGGYVDGAGNALSWVLIGNRFLFGVRSVEPAAGSTPPAFVGTTLLPGGWMAYSNDGLGAISGAWDADGNPMGSVVPSPVQNATVKQVFLSSEMTGATPTGVLRLMLRAAVSTGTASYNGTYDIHAVGIGLGIRAADIDVTGWEALDDELGVAYGIGRSRLFIGSEGETFDQWAQEEGRTIGFSFAMVNGVIAPRRTPSLGLAASAAFAITQSDLAKPDERPGSTEGPATVFNVGTLWSHWTTFGEGEDGFRDLLPIINDIESQERHGVRRPLEIKNKGLLGIADVAALLGQLGARVRLFRQPLPTLKMTLSRRWWGRIAPLDVFTWTNPAFPDRNVGTIGVTAKICVVKSVTRNFRDATVGVEFYVFPMQRQAPLAPSALLDFDRGDGGWDAGNSRIYCKANEFSATTDPVDVSRFSATDRILICEDATTTPATPQFWRRTVDSVTAASNYLTISGGALAGFVATRRYFVTFDFYSVQTTDQRSRASSIADNTDRRIGATTDWYPYV